MDMEEARLSALWQTAPESERQGRYADASALWEEALALKQRMGITGAGDIAELDAIQAHITRLRTHANDATGNQQP